jgi:SAM-dependent methyltransferase
MDYDNTALATTCDAARGYRPEVLRQWLDTIAGNIPHRPTLIVDLGCGTGRYAYALAERFKTRVIGIDPWHRSIGDDARQCTRKALQRRRGVLQGIGRAIALGGWLCRHDISVDDRSPSQAPPMLAQ